jgi:hypothetical protein
VRGEHTWLQNRPMQEIEKRSHTIEQPAKHGHPQSPRGQILKEHKDNQTGISYVSIFFVSFMPWW